MSNISPEAAADTLRHAVGVASGIPARHIAGLTYDWELWPWWVVGGLGMDEVVAYAIQQNMRTAMVGIGVPLYAAIRKLPRTSLLRLIAEAEGPIEETSTARE